MFASNLSDWPLQHPMGTVFIVICAYIWMAKRYMTNNPNVKDAAKAAVANKAISVIGRFFR
jgi:hypothetical protein